jgi:hypothetical protein
MNASKPSALGAAALCIALAILAPPPARAQVAADDAQAADAAIDVQYHLSRARARRGAIARIVFSVKTPVPLRRVAVAIDFDESRLRVVAVNRLTFIEGSPLALDALASIIHNNRDEEFGNQSDEGFVFAVVDSGEALKELGVSSGEFIPVLSLDFVVLNDAPFGFSPCVFKVVQNRANLEPAMVYANQVERADEDGVDRQVALNDENFQGGGIEIIGEVGFFMRGDANFDERRDIADPIYSLKFLFGGGPRLPCEDAGDSNDDGILDVSDPIFTLTRLFASSLPFPEPVKWGRDPTADELGCDIYTRGD